MPIEIRELIITATVDRDKDAGKGGPMRNKRREKSQDDLNEAVEQVFKAIKRKTDR